LEEYTYCLALQSLVANIQFSERSATTNTNYDKCNTEEYTYHTLERQCEYIVRMMMKAYGNGKI